MLLCETLDGIGGLNRALHGRRKGVKRQSLFFLFSQASHRFGIAFAVFGFEGCQLDNSLLFAALLPDRHELGGNLTAFASRDGSEDIALLMDQTALTRSCRKQ